MDYKQRRYKRGITAYTASKCLGIDFNKYKEVERGDRELNGEYLDKFNEMLRPENATELKFKEAEDSIKATEWFKTHNANEEISKLGYYTKDVSKIL